MDKYYMENQNRPIIWSIAGSDCSGGAGIQADIKTGHALGCEVCTLITANTVQNSQCLQSVNPVPIAILQQQFDCLLADLKDAEHYIHMEYFIWKVDQLSPSGVRRRIMTG